MLKSAIYKANAEQFVRHHGGFGQYFFCSLMNIETASEYIHLMSEFGARYYDGITWPSGADQRVDLKVVLGDDIARLRVPILYFVDSIALLSDNSRWFSRRQHAQDIIVDLDGHILRARDVDLTERLDTV